MDDSIQYYEPGDPVTEEQIARFERQLGIQLPQDYRVFLLHTNGGHPEPDAFPIRNNPRDTHALIAWFFSLDEKLASNDLCHCTKTYRGRIPSELLPIATDPGGNIICLAISGKRKGAVFFWDHDNESPPGHAPHYHNIYFVAHSFDELLNNLTKLRK